MKLKRLALLPAFLLVLTSCTGGARHAGEEGQDHEDHAVSVTLWQDGMELFAEFHPPVDGERTTFVILLTRLEDFRPMPDGKVAVVLRNDGRIVTSESVEKAARTGIWIVEIDSPGPGNYELGISYSGDGSTVFEAGVLKAFATEEEAARAGDAAFTEYSHVHAEDGEHAHVDAEGGEHEHGEEPETVSFLKEQQWNTEFLVEESRAMRMRTAITTVAEVVPRQSGYAEIVTPVEGFLNIHHNQGMAVPGKRISRGDPLLTICPPLLGTGSWIERQLAYTRARQEFERAERLIAREAISQRDYDEIRKTWLVEKASYETILRGCSAEPETDAETGEIHLVLNAPVNGIVASVGVIPGQTVAAGQKLMTIVDPSVVWLRADMFEKDYYRMGIPHGAALLIPGMDVSMRIGNEDLKLLSRGDIFDRESMTIPVIFETENTDELLKIGQVVQMEIYTSEEAESVAVPESSIIDEDYARYVFVQHGGESFEKRAVTTGARSGGLVAITAGLAAGERVVTRGAYSVKLASSKSETGSAHVH